MSGTLTTERNAWTAGFLQSRRSEILHLDGSSRSGLPIAGPEGGSAAGVWLDTVIALLRERVGGLDEDLLAAESGLTAAIPDEVLEQLPLIRTLCTQHLRACGEAGLAGCTEQEALESVAAFFDGILIAAARHAVAEREAALRRAEELEELNRQLQETDLASAATNRCCLQMARTIAHELRNTLSPVTIALKMLRWENDERQREELRQIINRAMESSHELVEQLSDYSGLISGRVTLQVEKFSALAFFEHLCSEFSMLAESKNLAFFSTFDPRLGFLVSDRQKLKEIAENLLTNALKYTPAGTVTLQFSERDEETWELAVQDTGIGIPTGMEERIFEEFERGSCAGRYDGSGLGLAIVRRLAKLCGGSVSAHRLPVGSRFQAILPRVMEAPAG